MCFAPQRLAIFHLSSGQMALHPPLQRVYFSTLWNHQIWEKHKGFATFLPFRAPASSFFRLFLFSDLLSSSRLFSSFLFSSRLVSSLLFSSLILPTSAFSPVHIVGKLTSKLHSQNQYTSVSTNVIRCKPMETNIYIYIYIKISKCIYQCKSMYCKSI